MIVKRKGLVRLIAGSLAAIVLAAAFLWSGHERRLGNEESLTLPAAKPLAPLTEQAPVKVNDSSSVSTTAHDERAHNTLAEEYESMMLGDLVIDEFILRHLELAEDGSAESAYYVSEAMKYCSVDLLQFEISFDQDRDRFQGIELTPNEIADQIMVGLIGLPEFYRAEVKRHLDRAIACQRLGWTPEFLIDQGRFWEATAAERGQVIAVARAAALNPSTDQIDEVRLEASKKTMRDLLQKTTELRVLLYASSVVSKSTGSDPLTERLTWALVACEYNRCDESLNYFFRHNCEVMSLKGSDICTDDMTDIDYLFRKYPAKYDAALARAREIKQAVSTRDWHLIGLD